MLFNHIEYILKNSIIGHLFFPVIYGIYLPIHKFNFDQFVNPLLPNIVNILFLIDNLNNVDINDTSSF